MGVEKQVLRAGTGPKVVRGQNVTVHCTGFVPVTATTSPGMQESPRSSVVHILQLLPQHHQAKIGISHKSFGAPKILDRRHSFKIGQGSVIKGWDEGVLDMQIGEIARLQCSPDYAYGASGFPAWGIQPNSVLVFEIEVLSAQ